MSIQKDQFINESLDVFRAASSMSAGGPKVTAAEEQLFRRWQSGTPCAALAAEANVQETQMLGVIAGIWRRLGRQ